MVAAAASLIYLLIVAIVHALQARCRHDGARTHAHMRLRCAMQDHRELSFIQSLIRGGTEAARAPSPFSRRAAAADTHFKSLAAPKP